MIQLFWKKTKLRESFGLKTLWNFQRTQWYDTKCDQNFWKTSQYSKNKRAKLWMLVFLWECKSWRCQNRLIVIKKSVRFCEIDWDKVRSSHKLQEPILLTVTDKIFKFSPHFDTFGQVNYLYEHFSGYPSYPTQKSYIWASFQTSRKRFHKLKEPNFKL